jgi:hypothetical protein
LLGRVLPLRWVTWRRLLSVTLLTAVLAWRSAIAAGDWICLLVLRVVAAINGTEEELDDPEIGRKVHRRVGAHHLFLLVFEVYHLVSKDHS